MLISAGLDGESDDESDDEERVNNPLDMDM